MVYTLLIIILVVVFLVVLFSFSKKGPKESQKEPLEPSVKSPEEKSFTKEGESTQENKDVMKDENNEEPPSSTLPES